jgi:hypothetical protein
MFLFLFVVQQHAISQEELDMILDRQLIFGDDPVYLQRGGTSHPSGKALPKEGRLYDVVDASIDSILDDMASKA